MKTILSAFGLRAACLATAAGVALVHPASVMAQEQQRDFDIPAQDAAAALNEWARQANTQIVFPYDQVEGKRTPRVRGSLTPSQALARLTSRLDLQVVSRSNGTVTLGNGAGAPVADASQNSGISEILVIGSNSQNVDIVRTEDAPQPYVVFDADEIARSQATNVADFFRKRLTANTTAGVSADGDGITSNISRVDLRGLGADETLILIDGRRATRLGESINNFTQGDLNTIPLEAIERIEVLPSTAGAIYGGGALGGVINIVRKRKYNGVTAKLGFDGTFRGGGETFRAELSGGFSLFDGKTQISFSGSHTASRPLYVEDNDLWRAGRQLLQENADSIFFGTYTSNIRSSNGSELTLKPAYGGASLGSNHTYIPEGYQGVDIDGAQPLIANAGQYSFELSDDSFGRYETMRNNPRVQAANINVRQEITTAIDAFVDFNISENKGRFNNVPSRSILLLASSPANPFQQNITINYPSVGIETPVEYTATNKSITGGMIARLSSDWVANLEYSWGRAEQFFTGASSSLASSIIADTRSGALPLLRDVNQFPVDLTPYITNIVDSQNGPYRTTSEILTGRVSGKLFDIGGGPVNLTTLAEYRNEKFARNSNTDSTNGFALVSFGRSQRVYSGYAELLVPVFSDRNGLPGLRELSLQLSVRHDDYRTNSVTPLSFVDFGGTPEPDTTPTRNDVSSTDYTIAAKWAPIPELALRASYSTGFLAPSIGQLSPGAPLNGSINRYFDPKRNELIGTPYQYQSGGNPDLLPEDSKSFSAGLIFKPRFLEGFRFSVDYTDIRKSGEIGTLGSFQTIIDLEDLFPDRIQRGDPLPGDPAGTPGPITFIDLTLENFAKTRVEAWDFNASYDFSVDGLGDVRVYGLVTHQALNQRQILPTSDPFEVEGFIDGPLEWRGAFGAVLDMGQLTLGWDTQFYDSYSLYAGNPDVDQQRAVDLQGGDDRIPSQIYNDVTFEYRFDNNAPLLRGVSVSASIQNIFDKKPPAIARAVNGYSAYGDPRLRRFTLSLRKHF